MVKDFRLSHKKTYDPVHGFIRFDDDEKILIDSFPFQRLHYIHQMGNSYLVFPGATHTRFEHSLGVMELSSRIYQKLCKNVRPDLFNFLPRSGSLTYTYWKKIIRMAALCHDLGQLPFSQVFEKEFLKNGENEGYGNWTFNIIKSHYLEKVWKKICSKLIYAPSQNVEDFINDILKISLGERALKRVNPEKDYEFDNWHRILSDIIHGDFFGADKIDSLLRDSKFTGVNYGLFDYLELIEGMRILPESEKEGANLEIGVDETGIESCEALMLANHFMQKKVYQNSSVFAYNFHLKRFMKIISSDDYKNVDHFLSQNDISVLNELNLASKNKMHKGHEDAKTLIYRKDRFKAISLSDIISGKDLTKFKNKLNLEDDKIYWEISEKKEEMSLAFPVVKEHMTIVKAKDLSSLLSKISFDLSNWVYISPDHEISLIQFLEKK